jgi:hypothetical protein
MNNVNTQKFVECLKFGFYKQTNKHRAKLVAVDNNFPIFFGHDVFILGVSKQEVGLKSN